MAFHSSISVLTLALGFIAGALFGRATDQSNGSVRHRLLAGDPISLGRRLPCSSGRGRTNGRVLARSARCTACPCLYPQVSETEFGSEVKHCADGLGFRAVSYFSSVLSGSAALGRPTVENMFRESNDEANETNEVPKESIYRLADHRATVTLQNEQHRGNAGYHDATAHRGAKVLAQSVPVVQRPEESERGRSAGHYWLSPFRDYRLFVTFTHVASGKSYRVPGYYAADGRAAETGAASGNVWRAHFMPDAEGEWKWTASFRQGRNVAVSDDESESQPLAFDGARGLFQIGPSDKTGRDFRAQGRLDYIGQRYLRFTGSGQYFLKGAIHGHGEVEPCIGVRDDYHHQFALELAKHGYVVLCPEHRGFGVLSNLAHSLPGRRLDYWQKGSRSFTLATDSFLKGKPLIGATVEDFLRWEQWLVQHLGIGTVHVVGISYGGDLALLYPVFSSRVDRIFASGTLGSFVAIYPLCYNAPTHCIPGILDWMDRSDIAGLNAPRSIALHYGELDVPGPQNFSASYNETVPTSVEELKAIYAATSAADKVILIVTKGKGHEMDIKAMLSFLDKQP